MKIIFFKTLLTLSAIIALASCNESEDKKPYATDAQGRRMVEKIKRTYSDGTEGGFIFFYDAANRISAVTDFYKDEKDIGYTIDITFKKENDTLICIARDANYLSSSHFILNRQGFVIEAIDEPANYIFTYNQNNQLQSIYNKKNPDKTLYFQWQNGNMTRCGIRSYHSYLPEKTNRSNMDFGTFQWSCLGIAFGDWGYVPEEWDDKLDTWETYLSPLGYFGQINAGYLTVDNLYRRLEYTFDDEGFVTSVNCYDKETGKLDYIMKISYLKK